MRTLLPWVTVIALAACGGDDGGGPDAVHQPVLEGGRFAIAGCGYEVVTRMFAEAPAPGDAVLGADPTPTQIHLGIGGDPRTSMAIVWRTDPDTTVTRVRYGRAGDALDQEAEGVTFRYASGIQGIGDLIRLHEAHLCGLDANTAYDYQVGGDGAWSAIHSFRTAPDVAVDPDAEVVVGYLGDSRGGYSVLAQVAAALGERAPDLLVFTGDTVTIGQSQAEWDSFFAAAPELFASVPMIAAHGNHEVNAVHYYSLLAMPGDEENFSFDFGHLHQVVVNSDPTNIADLTGAIPDFLEADLAASDARWTVVSMHRSLWSSSTRHGSDETLRTAWGPILDDHAVDLVVAGHDHIFERTRPLRGGVPQETFAEGTVYMISGGAGAPLYGVEASLPSFSHFAESTFNATTFAVRRDMLRSESFRPDGSPIDAFTISKP
jgi:acid phosphatase type 7